MLLSDMGDNVVMQSCYEGNEEQCIEYLPCLVLSKAITATESNSTSSNTIASSSAIQSTTVPSMNLSAFEVATPTLDSPVELQDESGLPVAASTNLTVTTEPQNELQSNINTTSFAPIPPLNYLYNSEEADLSVTDTIEGGKLPVEAETATESQNKFQSNLNFTSYAPIPTLNYNPYNGVGGDLST